MGYQFEKGHPGGPGRPKGSKSKMSEEIKAQFSRLLENKLPEVEEWLTRVAAKDPDKAIDAIIKISERFVPKLTQNQLTDGEGQPLNFTFKFGQKPEDTQEETE